MNQVGKVTGVGAGTATITCRATDGSGKKATVKVKVITPVSYVKITPSIERFMYSNYVIAAGCSATNKVTYGDAFGKPSDPGVEYSWSAYTYRGGYHDLTDELKAAGLVKLTTSGKLTLKKGMAAYEGCHITVYAEATDGSWQYDSVDYYVTAPTKYLKAEAKTVMGSYYDLEGWGETDIFVYTTEFTTIKATSSNPSVSSIYGYMELLEEPDPDNPDAPTYSDFGINPYVNGERIYVYLVVCVNGGPGKADIKIETIDGTNKSVTVSTTVK